MKRAEPNMVLSRGRGSSTVLLLLPMLICAGTERSNAQDVGVVSSWRVFDESDGLNEADIHALHVNGEELWVGTSAGLARYELGHWTTWKKSERWPAPTVCAIAVDPVTDDVWLGSWGHGLFRLTAGRFDDFNQLGSGLAGDLVWGVAVYDGRVWAATNAGISSFSTTKEQWNLYFARRIDKSTPLATCFARMNDELVAGVWPDGVYRYNRERDRWSSLAFQPLNQTSDYAPGGRRVYASSAIAAGPTTLWTIDGESLLRRDADGRWARRRVPFVGRRDVVVTSMAAATDQQLWLGTNAGLWALNDWDRDMWVVYAPGSGGAEANVQLFRRGVRIGARRVTSTLPSDNVRALAVSGENVWVGTDRGLALADVRVRWSELPELSVASTKTGAPGVKADPANTTHPQTEVSASVGIAILGPRSRTIALPGDRAKAAQRINRPDLLAVQVCVEHVNARGGYRAGTPFDLSVRTTGYASYGWGTREDDFYILASYPQVAGIVGVIRSDDTTFDAAAFKTETPLVSVTTDDAATPGAHLKHPWVFRCWGEAPRRHRALLDHLAGRRGVRRIAIVDSEVGGSGPPWSWWREYAKKKGLDVVARIGWGGEGGADRAKLLALGEARPDVVMTWADAPTSSAVLASLRRNGIDALFVGGAALTTDEFVERMPVEPGEMLALVDAPTLGKGELLLDFARQYADRNVVARRKVGPNAHAHRSYEATDHLLAAVKDAGSDRRHVRQTLDLMSRSVFGEMHYERLYPPAKLTMVVWSDGQWRLETVPASGGR